MYQYKNNSTYNAYIGVGGSIMGGNYANNFFIESASSSIIFNTNGRTSGSTPNMIVHTTGNVGIGTTNPGELLHLYTISTTNAFIKADASGGTGQAGLRLYAGSGTTNRSTRMIFQY